MHQFSRPLAGGPVDCRLTEVWDYRTTKGSLSKWRKKAADLASLRGRWGLLSSTLCIQALAWKTNNGGGASRAGSFSSGGFGTMTFVSSVSSWRRCASLVLGWGLWELEGCFGSLKGEWLSVMVRNIANQFPLPLRPSPTAINSQEIIYLKNVNTTEVINQKRL